VGPEGEPAANISSGGNATDEYKKAVEKAKETIANVSNQVQGGSGGGLNNTGFNVTDIKMTAPLPAAKQPPPKAQQGADDADNPMGIIPFSKKTQEEDLAIQAQVLAPKQYDPITEMYVN